MELQIMKMEKKIEAGARFFQTQAVYDLDAFERFMRRVEGLGAEVLGGIILLKSVGMARYMNKNIAGVFVPEPLIQELKKAEDKARTSMKIAVDLVKGMKDLCQGVHIMAMGWESKIPSILDDAGL
jgi:5,10-methylenetetrahydrofolate reductase